MRDLNYCSPTQQARRLVTCVDSSLMVGENDASLMVVDIMLCVMPLSLVWYLFTCTVRHTSGLQSDKHQGFNQTDI